MATSKPWQQVSHGIKQAIVTVSSLLLEERGKLCLEYQFVLLLLHMHPPLLSLGVTLLANGVKQEVV